MSENLKAAVGWIVTVALLGAWAYNSWVIQPEKQRQRATERRAEASQRFRDWAYIAKEKQIAPGETVKLIVIPSPRGHELFDTKCLIYTHQEFKTGSMICPDARQDDIEMTE